MLFNRFIRLIKANLLSHEAPPAQSRYQEPFDSQSHSNQQQNKQQYAEYTSANQKEKTYYAALEVEPGASFDEIKAAYKKLVKKYHPDLFHNNPEKRRYAEIVTQKINEAYVYFEERNSNNRMKS